MEFNLKRHFLTENDCYKAGRTITPQGVMVHSTGVAQPDPEVFIRRWNKPDVDKCVHAFVGREQVIQTLPWTTRGWHAGTGPAGRSANNTHISFECCEPPGHTYQGGEMAGYNVEANRPYFNDLYENAVQLTAMLCREYGLDPLADGVVICHAEGHRRGIASNHGDVLHWWPKFGKSMDDFRADVAQAMRGEDEVVTYEQWKEYMDRYEKERAALPAPAWASQTGEWERAHRAGITADLSRPQSPATRVEVAAMILRAGK